MTIQYRSRQTLIGTRTNPSNPGDHTTTPQAVSLTGVTYSNINTSTAATPTVTIHLVVATGTPTGAFSIQQTNDPHLDDNGEVTGTFTSAQTQNCRWCEIYNTAVTAGVIAGSPAGSPNDFMFSVQNGSYATRVVYTNASGSGSIEAWLYGV